MQRITVTIDDDLLEQFDGLIRRRGYDNRSEAFRDVLRDRLERDRFERLAAPACVGCLTYVYGHGDRELPRRLVAAQHAHHDLTLSTLHLHLDHENCLEAAILRGPTDRVTAFAARVTAEKGVRHGHLWLVPVDLRLDSHDHGLGAGPEAGRAPSLPPAADIAFAASPMGGTAGGATAGGATAGGTAGRAEGGGTAGRAEGGGTSGGAEGGGTTDGRSAAAAQGPPVLPHVHSRPRT